MITPAQREARRHRIGSSDSAAVCGIDPYRSAADVYFEKIAATADLPNKAAIRIGNLFEPALILWAQEELGVELQANVSLDGHPSGILSANLDAANLAKRIGVEAKTTSQQGEYGEPGTDQVPDRVIVQCLHQCEVAELDVVYVPVLLARFDRLAIEMYRVNRNERGQSAIVERDVEFWHQHVVPRRPPGGIVPALEILKRIKRLPGSVAVVERESVTAWDAARQVRLVAEKEERAALAALLAQLGDAEAGDFGDASTWLTYMETSRKGYTVEPSTYRTPRIAKR